MAQKKPSSVAAEHSTGSPLGKKKKKKKCSQPAAGQTVRRGEEQSSVTAMAISDFLD
jgi:hypothetical protein